jgi:hypothetical protein
VSSPSSVLKKEATYSSETLVDFHWTARRYIPEDITFFVTFLTKTNSMELSIS